MPEFSLLSGLVVLPDGWVAGAVGWAEFDGQRVGTHLFSFYVSWRM